MSFPAVSGHRRRRSGDWQRTDDTVVHTDAAPAPAGFRRAFMPVLVDGEIMLYECDYELPRLVTDVEYIDALWREDGNRFSTLINGPDRKRARATASNEDAIQRCLREARAGDAGMPEDCAVCLQDFDADARETLRVTPCCHAFHPDCILAWLRIKPVCPLCRQDLPPQQHTKDQDFEDEDDTDSDTDSDEDDTDQEQEESTPPVPDPEEP